MSALRGFPSDFGYAPAREAERASDQALAVGFAASSVLLAIAFWATFVALPLLPRPVEVRVPGPNRPAGDLVKVRFDVPPPPAGVPAAPSIDPASVPLPVPDGPPAVAAFADEAAGGRESAGAGAGETRAIEAGGAGGEAEPQPGEFVYYEQEPVLIHQVLPEYTDFMRDAQAEGSVILWARVERDGSVGEVRVRQSVPLLDAAAIAAVRRWRFTPALSSGRPVRVWIAVPVRFSLH